MPEESASAKKITRDELILAELRGKHEAIGRYDTILWRVRSGYVVVLYGSLLLFTGKEGGLAPLFERPDLIWTALVTVFVLSFILTWMDMGFRLRQLKVVSAYNRLSDIAFALAAGRETQDDELRSLLHIAGESAIPVAWLPGMRAVLLIGSLYLGPPALAFAAYIIIRGTR
jgi:hypothetical protein